MKGEIPRESMAMVDGDITNGAQRDDRLLKAVYEGHDIISAAYGLPVVEPFRGSWGDVVMIGEP